MAGTSKPDKGTGSRRQHGGKGKGGVKGPDSREKTISRALTFLLRHGAIAEGVELDDGGWANVADVLAWRRLSNLSVTLSEIHAMVATNDKQRFALKPDPSYHLLPYSNPTTHQQHPSLPPDDPSAYLIRASQGHSLKNISDALLLQPLLPTDRRTPRLVVHGTYTSAWSRILASGALKPMGRKHIHFATSLPSALPPLDKERPRKVPLAEDGEPVLSGMRRDATVLVWVDVIRSAQEGGVKWWRSENGVVLTEGVDGGVDLRWVLWVERRGVGEVLWGEKPVGGAAAGAFGVKGGEQQEAEGVRVADIVKEEVEGVEVGVERLDMGEGKGGGGAGGHGGEESSAKLKDNWDD